MTNESIERVMGVFTTPPAHFPTNLTTGAAVIGNGDLLAAIGGPAHKLEFRLSKLDFWQASDLGIGEKAASARAIGSLYLNAPQLEGGSYRLEQSIHDATVRGRFDKDGAGMSVAAWMPRGKNMLVVEISSTGSIPIAVEPLIVIQQGHESVVEQGTDSGISWYERRFETPNLLWPTAVTVAVRESQCARIVLAPGETHWLALAAVTNHDTTEYRKASISMASSLNNSLIAEARRHHTQWWEALWRKCAKVEIGDPYLEDQYYGSHYIMASCCGNKNFPPGLFAWITDDNPCWAGDYHTNYNYQSPWWGVLTSNLLELAEPYDQPVLDYLPRMQEFAKHYLGVRGAYCSVSFGPKGLHAGRYDTPIDDGMTFLGQKSNASFLAVNMIMRYYLTLDRDYAKEKAYPYISEVMQFWEDYLVFEPGVSGGGPDGRYVVPNDCVNECEFWRKLEEGHRDFERAKERNPVLTIGFIRMVARAAIEMSERLGKDVGRREKWRHILAHISAFPMTERNGKKMFDCCERPALTTLEELNMCCIQHIYPAGAVSLSSDAALVQAGVDTILYKNLWEQGNSFCTIFAAAARVGVDAGLILEKMGAVTRKFVQPNFMFQFGGGGIENNSGIPDGLNEMLMQSHEGFIRLFPCWPSGRPARFEGIRAYGAFLVSASWNGDAIGNVTITSEKGTRCRVMNCWGKQQVACVADGKDVPLARNGILEFDTEAGKTYRLEVKKSTDTTQEGEA